MPRVVIRSGELKPDGTEEILSEYLCDWPACSNVAEEVLGAVPDIGLFAAVCREHAKRPSTSSRE
jgi:hypothetical protein